VGPLTVLDTNIVIYLLEGRLAQPITDSQVSVSIITEIELLSWPHLDANGEAVVRDFLGSIVVIPLTTEVKEEAIRLRRRHGLKIPDAIVAASAIVAQAKLFTNDSRMVEVPGLKCEALGLRHV
jgi:predicted nucleic acid-binding protein